MDTRSYVDSVFHPQIFTPEQIKEIPGYAEEYGIRSFKFYMSGMPGIVNSITDDLLLEGFRTVARTWARRDCLRSLRDRCACRSGA